MKRVLTAVVLLALAAAPAHARQRPAPGGARLVDSFGDLLITDLKARLDYFAIELQNDPGARGFVVAYAAKNKFPGFPPRRARACVEYLTETRALGAERVSAVNGGLRDDTLFELWVVPAGAEPPFKPFDISLLMSGEKTPLPFDRFDVVERGDSPRFEYGEFRTDAPGLYDFPARVLRSDPSLRACIIGYASRRGSLAAARRIASRAKTAMARAHAVDVSRVVALGGGRREYKMVELWLVPPGSPLPKPTPDARPVRRKGRH